MQDNNQNTNQTKRYQVQEISENTGGTSPSGVMISPPASPPPGTIPFIPKKKRPKMLFIVLGLSILAIIIVIVLLFRKSGTTLLGTPGEIVWWGIQHEEVVYKPLIEEYQKQNPNVKIIYQKQSAQDYRERLTNALAKGEGPDIFEIHSTWPHMFKNDLASLPSSVMDQDEYNQTFYPVISSALSLEGKAVAMPLEYDAITLYINEDIFASAIKKPPVTWVELRDLADASKDGLTIREKEGRIIQSGAALGFTSNVDYWPEVIALMFMQNRVNPSKPNSELAGQVLSFYIEFRSLGTWDNTLPPSTIAFSRGNVAMYFGPTSRASDITRENPSLKFRTVPLPQLPKNAPSDPNYSYATFWAHGVWERSRNKEAAWGFLKFLAQRESLENINSNIEELEGYPRTYPRPEMNIQYRDDPILGSVVALVLDAKSWYLADNTNDGTTGINSQLEQVFGQTINDWGSGGGVEKLNKLTNDVQAILSKYTIPLK